MLAPGNSHDDGFSNYQTWASQIESEARAEIESTGIANVLLEAFDSSEVASTRTDDSSNQDLQPMV